MENWNFRTQTWDYFLCCAWFLYRPRPCEYDTRAAYKRKLCGNATRRLRNSDRETRAGSVRGCSSRRRASRQLLLRLRLFWCQYSTAIGGETVMGARRGHVDRERLTGSGHARAAFAATHGPDLLYSP